MLLLAALVCSLSLSVLGQEGNDNWLDPYDMINYDPVTKTMRKPPQPAKYDNVATKRREHTRDYDQAELLICEKQLGELQRQIEHQKKTITEISQQPTCNPVFKRFLSRLLKEMKRVGVPSHSTEVFYDAKVKMSKQTMTEIQSLLEGEDRWRTGALDNALSQILLDLKQHDPEIWKWRFEDSFGVELDTVLKIGLGVLVIMAIICTELWSAVSWFVQIKRLFAVCFFITVIWNWFYLYKTAFAEHQTNIVKLEGINDKCTGVKKFDWTDNLKEWFRSTLTLQDDPCKRYYEVLMVNPILLVPPNKALSMTFTAFFTDPLKHIGQGISEFLRALLKDLPIPLQIPVLLTVMLSIVVCLYGSVQAAFRHGIMAPLRGIRRDPPPPGLEQQRRPEPEQQRLPEPEQRRLPPPPRTELPDPYAGGDAPPPRRRPRPPPERQQAIDDRLPRNQVHRRRPDRTREKPIRVVETLRTAEPRYSEDEVDEGRREENPEEELDLYAASDTENQMETTEMVEETTAANDADDKTKPASSDEPKSNEGPLKDDKKDEPNGNGAADRSQPAERQPARGAVQDLGPSDEVSLPPVSVEETGSS